MSEDLALNIFRARLNYETVREKTGWDHTMINDYLGITSGTTAIVDQLDNNTIQIALNADNIEDNSQLIGSLFTQIGKLVAMGAKIEAEVLQNTLDISQNTIDISANTLRIEDLEELTNRLVIWQ